MTGAVWLWLLAAATVLCAAGWWRAQRWRPRTVVVAALLGGAALRLLLVPTTPVLSTDLYRYLWDGRVQAAGTNPYAYPPDDRALAGLRDDAVWRHVNRRGVPTIYPGGAELVFAGTYRAGLTTPTGWKLLTALTDLATVAALVMLLRRHGAPLRHVLLYAWNPLPVLAFGQAGHVDALAVLPLVLAVAAWHADRPGRAGGLLGVAVAIKLYPLLLVPAFLRRRDGRWAPATAVVAVVVPALAYLPYRAVGRRVLGYLGDGYLREEGYASGRRFVLASAVGVDGVLLAAVVLAGLSVWALRTRWPVEVRAAVLLGATLVVTTPYGWYATGLVALAAAGAHGGLPAPRRAAPLVWPAFGVGLYAIYVLVFFGIRPVTPTTMRLALVGGVLVGLAVGIRWRAPWRTSAVSTEPT